MMPPTGYICSAFFVVSPATVAVLTFVSASGVTKNSCQSFSSCVMDASTVCAFFSASDAGAGDGSSGAGVSDVSGVVMSGCSAACAPSGSSPS